LSFSGRNHTVFEMAAQADFENSMSFLPESATVFQILIQGFVSFSGEKHSVFVAGSLAGRQNN